MDDDDDDILMEEEIKDTAKTSEFLRFFPSLTLSGRRVFQSQLFQKTVLYVVVPVAKVEPA